MAILKIARMGHPVLQSPAEPVAEPGGAETVALVRDMVETLNDIGGLGLAAPQVHVPKRLVIFHIPAGRSGQEDDPLDGAEPLTVLINPVIEPLSAETELGWEACLSLPGLTGEVPRYTHIRYRALGLDGEPMEREAKGFHARVVQHECDHLDGVLYPMRMDDMSRFGFVEDIRRGRSAGEFEEEEDDDEDEEMAP
jgi:peptide deformylase